MKFKVIAIMCIAILLVICVISVITQPMTTDINFNIINTNNVEISATFAKRNNKVVVQLIDTKKFLDDSIIYDFDDYCLGEYDYNNFPFEYNISVESGIEQIETYVLSSNYIIASYKIGNPHKNKLNEHIYDELIMLNHETKNCDIIYKSDKTSRILYGDNDVIIVYNAKNNTYQYLNTTDKAKIFEKDANLKTSLAEYDFYYDFNKNHIEIYRNNYFNNFYMDTIECQSGDGSVIDDSEKTGGQSGDGSVIDKNEY